MKGILLIGPGESGKRAYLQKLKKELDSNQVSLIDLKSQSLKDLENSLISQSLFDNGKRLVVVENLPKNFDLDSLHSDDDNLALVFVVTGESAALFKAAKQLKYQILEFAGEKELTAFAYLDALLEGKVESLTELSKLLETFGGLYVISMIYYGLRRNFLPLPAPQFVQNKIRRQKSRFKLEDWTKLYFQTLTAESQIKTGLGQENVTLNFLTEKFLEK